MTTKRRKAVFLALYLLLTAGLAALLFFYRQQGFTGTRVKSPAVYSLEIRQMNGTDRHTLALHQGDALQIRFETEKGALYLEIQTPDGTALYQGNGETVTDFTVNVPQDGMYPVVVTARRAKGTIHIQRREGAA